MMWDRRWVQPGHNYIANNYIGHNYIGHNYIGHHYIGDNYIDDMYMMWERRRVPSHGAWILYAE